MTGAIQRDWVLELHQHQRPGLIATADRIARRLCESDGSTCMPRVIAEMRRLGYGPQLADQDPRWCGAVLLPSRGWERTGELVNEGSKARPVPLWRRREAA